MANKGKYLKDVPAKGKRWKKILLIILAVFLVLLLGLGAFGVYYYNNLLGYVSRAEKQEQQLSDAELEEILGFVPETRAPAAETEAAEQTLPTETVQEKEASDGILNLMLVGQARRDGEDSKLSDTMILFTVNKESKTLTLTSFLRDTYVKLPDFKNHICGMQRINVAYNLGWRWEGDLGGMEMLDQLILENFGVEVDHNVEIDFDSFRRIIDHIGGVTLELTKDEAEYLNACSLPTRFSAGTTTLDGSAALEYARMRKSNGSDSDIHRTARQRKIITLLVQRLMKMNLSQIDSLLKDILPMVLTDMTNEEITSVMMELIPLLPELTIVSNQCPMEGTYHGQMVKIGGMDAAVLVPDLEPNRQMLMEICEGISVSEE